ncbi:MAG: TIGR04076 family protein [Negativicutes bacterium]|nr:TIGR04076 family protein [Negativicutes bacterium]
MQAWYAEEYSFRLEVLHLAPDDQPQRCRVGHQPGDRFHCSYGCPGGLCSKTMLKAFPIMEAARSGGDLRNLGGRECGCMEFVCPDGIVTWRLRVHKSEAV